MMLQIFTVFSCVRWKLFYKLKGNFDEQITRNEGMTAILRDVYCVLSTVLKQCIIFLPSLTPFGSH